MSETQTRGFVIEDDSFYQEIFGEYLKTAGIALQEVIADLATAREKLTAQLVDMLAKGPVVILLDKILKSEREAGDQLWQLIIELLTASNNTADLHRLKVIGVSSRKQDYQVPDNLQEQLSFTYVGKTDPKGLRQSLAD